VVGGDEARQRFCRLTPSNTENTQAEIPAPLLLGGAPRLVLGLPSASEKCGNAVSARYWACIALRRNCRKTQSADFQSWRNCPVRQIDARCGALRLVDLPNLHAGAPRELHKLLTCGANSRDWPVVNASPRAQSATSIYEGMAGEFEESRTWRFRSFASARFPQGDPRRETSEVPGARIVSGCRHPGPCVEGRCKQTRTEPNHATILPNQLCAVGDSCSFAGIA